MKFAMNIRNCIAVGMGSLGLFTAVSSQATVTIGTESVVQNPPAWAADKQPTGKGWGTTPPAGTGYTVHVTAGLRKTSGSNGINYHGGPLILGTTNVYYIWYGNWSSNTATSILPALATGLSGSPYFNINTTYYNGGGVAVTNSVAYKSSTTNNYSFGTALPDADVASVVSTAITSGALPTDTNGVYFVLTSADVSETSGFCTSYCGWHTHQSVNGNDIKYAFVGNPAACPSACEAQSASSPNNNPGADGMANIIAHELEEAVTDEDLNAWYDSTGAENADKCAWKFGSTYTVSNGSVANMQLGSLNFLIQENWLNANGGVCALSH